MIDAASVSILLQGVHVDDVKYLLQFDLVCEVELLDGFGGKRYDVRLKEMHLAKAMEVLPAPWRA